MVYRPKELPDKPLVHEKVVYRYRTLGGEPREITVKTWRCNFPISQRKKCKVKIIGPSAGPVQHSSDMHWAKHLEKLNGHA